MTGTDRVVQVLTDFLEDAPDRAPDQLLETVLADVRKAPQRARWRLALGRFPTYGSHIVRYAGVAGVAGLAVIIAFGVWGGVGIGPGQPSSSPSPAPSPRPLPASVPLSAGTYLYDHHAFTTVPFQFTVPDGWVIDNGGWNIGKNLDQPSAVSFASAVLDNVNADACAGTQGELLEAGSTVDDLVDALLEQSGPAVAVEGPFDVTLGGYSGQRLDLTSPPAADFEDCMVPGLQLWRDQAGNFFVALADWQISIYVLDVGDRVVLMTQHQEASPAADVAELEAVIESIEFVP